MDKPILTAERLRALLSYDKDTGIFIWLVYRTGTAPAGSIAGCHHEGYRKIRIDRNTYAAHRLAWLHVYGVWPSMLIDHINADKSDNRILNLRDVNHTANAQNSIRVRSHSTTGFLGVSVHKSVHRVKKYVARITVSKRKVHLGYFTTAEEASAVYLAAKRGMHVGYGSHFGFFPALNESIPLPT